jgi:hypothetical protein
MQRKIDVSRDTTRAQETTVVIADRKSETADPPRPTFKDSHAGMSLTTTSAAVFCMGVSLLASLSDAAMDPNIRLTVNSTSIRDGDMIKVSSPNFISVSQYL